jgi:hypothetical protein
VTYGGKGGVRWHRREHHEGGHAACIADSTVTITVARWKSRRSATIRWDRIIAITGSLGIGGVRELVSRTIPGEHHRNETEKQDRGLHRELDHHETGQQGTVNGGEGPRQPGIRAISAVGIANQTSIGAACFLTRFIATVAYLDGEPTTSGA